MIKICDMPFDPAKELDAFNKKSATAGAIVSFLGKVRGTALEQTGNDEVCTLKLEHYPGLTERSIMEIDLEARRRWSIEDILILHRVGALSVGEPIVFVCVSAAHRRAAFEAADFLMDFLKTKAMFWKKEIRNDGEAWIEPRAADYQDANKWRWDQ